MSLQKQAQDWKRRSRNRESSERPNGFPGVLFAVLATVGALAKEKV